jgi:uncharacterized protein YbjT (DUF2867 family)
MPNTAVIARATGYLGGYVAVAARKAKHNVRALVQDAERSNRETCDGVFEGQAPQAEALSGYFDGADVAFSSIGVRRFRRRPTIWEVGTEANLNLVAAAARAGVRCFILVSVLGAPEESAKFLV